MFTLSLYIIYSSNNFTFGQVTNANNRGPFENNNQFILNLTQADPLVPVLGNPNANVTVIEFGDFQCKHCSEFNRFQKDLLIKNYVNSGIAKFTFKDFTVNDQPGNNASTLAAEASYCAAEQDKYWLFHDKVFRSYEERPNGSINKSILVDYAKKVNVSKIDQFEACLSTGKYLNIVNKNNYFANQLGLLGTPTFAVYSSNYPFLIKLIQGDKNHTDLEGKLLLDGFENQK